MDPDVVLPEIAAIATAFVIFPAALCAASDAGRAQEVTCPESGQAAQVQRGAGRAVLALFTGARERVCGCSRWPEKAGCDRACEANVRGW